MSPTARTLDKLRKQGYAADVVERWIKFGNDGKPCPLCHCVPDRKRGVRRDFLHIIDVIGCHPEYGTVGVQACAGSSFAEHIAKVLGEPVAKTWLLAGRGHHRLEVWGWRKLKVKRGGKAVRWEVRTREIRLEDYDNGKVANAT